MITDLEYGIGRLRLEPGDVLVIKIAGGISTELVARFRAEAKHVLGEDTKVLVLGDRVDLSILTKAEIEAKVAA
jgi:hypothetical protein